ncbi:conserved hypothetical protein [Burkholderia latens]|uniref:hypothetical protein n=1 Tax=Burkholderia latens TaxID=488446 RepID=UPI0039A6C60D
MPQNPIVPRPGGSLSALDVSASTVVKTSPGTLYRVSVTTAGSAAGAAYDAAATNGNVATNLIAAIPNTVGVYLLEWPCANGILIVPGTGQVVSVSYA